jgi:hypothetical protein
VVFLNWILSQSLCYETRLFLYLRYAHLSQELEQEDHDGSTERNNGIT